MVGGGSVVAGRLGLAIKPVILDCFRSLLSVRCGVGASRRNGIPFGGVVVVVVRVVDLGGVMIRVATLGGVAVATRVVGTEEGRGGDVVVASASSATVSLSGAVLAVWMGSRLF